MLITTAKSTDTKITAIPQRLKANLFGDRGVVSDERIVLIAREYVPEALKSNIESIMCQGCRNLCAMNGDNICRKTTLHGYWPGVETASGIVVSCEERVLVSGVTMES